MTLRPLLGLQAAFCSRVFSHGLSSNTICAFSVLLLRTKVRITLPNDFFEDYVLEDRHIPHIMGSNLRVFIFGKPTLFLISYILDTIS